MRPIISRPGLRRGLLAAAERCGEPFADQHAAADVRVAVEREFERGMQAEIGGRAGGEYERGGRNTRELLLTGVAQGRAVAGEHALGVAVFRPHFQAVGRQRGID